MVAGPWLELNAREPLTSSCNLAVPHRDNNSLQIKAGSRIPGFCTNADALPVHTWVIDQRLLVVLYHAKQLIVW